jgi:hypothetical protein
MCYQNNITMNFVSIFYLLNTIDAYSFLNKLGHTYKPLILFLITNHLSLGQAFFALRWGGGHGSCDVGIPAVACIGGANTGSSLVSRPGSFFWQKKLCIDLSLLPHANCQTPDAPT